MTAFGQQLTMSPVAAPPLLVSSDAGIIDAVKAVAAEAGVEVATASDAAAAARSWASAPMVMVDPTELVGVQQLPSRRAVVVVTRTITEAETWRTLLASGAEHIVELPQAAPWLFERMGRSLEVGPAARTGVVVVAGAVGGVGASTLAAALATYQADADRPGVLVDLDAQGGGIDLMLGAEDTPGARWHELAGISGPVDESVLLQALPARGSSLLLSWPPNGEIEPDVVAVGHVLDALVRAPNPVVVDVGRGHGRYAQVALARADACVIVLPLRVRAVAAVQGLLRRLSPHVEPVVVARAPAPGGLTAADVSRVIGVPVVATLVHDRRRAADEEVGDAAPRSVSWRRVCEAVLTSTAGQP